MSVPFLLCMGFIVGITDGDTLRVKCNAPNLGELRVRLAEIDAPERRQPFGSKAKDALSDLAMGRVAKIIQVDVDRYARVVARVEPVGQPEVNFEMVRLGYAWCYPKYRERTEECRSAEQTARDSKAGLWVDAIPTAPWEFRQKPKAAATFPAASERD